MSYRIRNWRKFQHFKDRRPPWIKVHKEILDQRDINAISDRSFRVLIGLWLLASEDEEMQGGLPEIADIAFRLRMPERDLLKAFQELTPFLECDDISAISARYQVDDPETETETETYTETETETETVKNGTITAKQVQAVVDYWNAQAVLPTARGISEKRDKAIRALLKDTATRNCWKDSIDAVTTSEFHLGKNERGWKITFDWWARPEKVLQFAERGKRERVDKHGNAVTIETDVDELGF